MQFIILVYVDFISTHILTRRMTIFMVSTHEHSCISTHILTRRMTTTQYLQKIFKRNFNSHPHKEDDSNFKQKQSI